MPSDSRNSTMAKATGLIFFAVQHRFSPRGAFSHAAMHTIYSSWTCLGPHHLSLLPTKGVEFVIGM